MSATGPAAWDAADWDAFDKKGVTAFWFRDISPGADVVDPAWSTLWKVHEMVEDLTTVPPGSTVVSGLTDEALAAVATAVADEQHRRSAD